MKEEIINAQIDGTMLGFEDHCIMTILLKIRLPDRGHVMFGGYALGGEYLNKHVSRILNVVGASEWEKIKGKHVRIKKEEGYFGKIIAIGNLMEDEWFNPSEIK